jgi:hypothetical protein
MTVEPEFMSTYDIRYKCTDFIFMLLRSDERYIFTRQHMRHNSFPSMNRNI